MGIRIEVIESMSEEEERKMDELADLLLDYVDESYSKYRGMYVMDWKDILKVYRKGQREAGFDILGHIDNLDLEGECFNCKDPECPCRRSEFFEMQGKLLTQIKYLMKNKYHGKNIPDN